MTACGHEGCALERGHNGFHLIYSKADVEQGRPEIRVEMFDAVPGWRAYTTTPPGALRSALDDPASPFRQLLQDEALTSIGLARSRFHTE